MRGRLGSWRRRRRGGRGGSEGVALLCMLKMDRVGVSSVMRHVICRPGLAGQSVNQLIYIAQTFSLNVQISHCEHV